MKEHLQILSSSDDYLGKLIEQYGEIELEEPEIHNFEFYFKDLASSIVSQQLSVKAASTIWNRVEALLEFDISPEKIIMTSDDDLRQAGLSKRKVEYIKHLAQSVIDKKINLSNLHELSDEDVINELVKIKGIGRWTAEMFLIFTLKRPDVFSLGDLGLFNAMKRFYGEDLTKERQEEISKNWKPYRTYASLYLWKSLDNAPKK